MIVTVEMQEIVWQKAARRSAEILRQKASIPRLEPVQAFGRTKGCERSEGRRESRHPQKFSSQNEGLIAGAISLRTLRCRVALNIYTYVHVCVRVCVSAAPEAPLRASPPSKTSPARLHRSFASSRCFITMALGSPLASPPSFSFHGWRRCPVES